MIEPGTFDYKGQAWGSIGSGLGYLKRIDWRLVLTFGAMCDMLCLQSGEGYGSTGEISSANVRSRTTQGI